MSDDIMDSLGFNVTILDYRKCPYCWVIPRLLVHIRDPTYDHKLFLVQEI
jgi:glutaredoxin